MSGCIPSDQGVHRGEVKVRALIFLKLSGICFAHWASAVLARVPFWASYAEGAAGTWSS